MFGYSDEDGTEAETFEGKHDEDEIRARLAHVTDLVTALNGDRAEERIGEHRRGAGRGRGHATGPATWRAARPTRDRRSTAAPWCAAARTPRVGDLVRAVVVESDGVDLVAEATGEKR